MLEFGDKIKQLREAKGMTQQAMAEQLHVTRQAVSRWECGARLPDLHTTKKIAELLEVSIDELMTDEGEEKIEDNSVGQSFVGTVSLEKEPELSGRKQLDLNEKSGNTVQIILYAAITSFLCLIWIIRSYAFIDIFLTNSMKSFYGMLTMLYIGTQLLIMVVVVIGLVLSVKKCLKPEMIGYLMALPYFFDTVSWLVSYIYLLVTEKDLKYIEMDRVSISIMVCWGIVSCIIKFFKGSNRLYWGVCLIGILDIIQIIYDETRVMVTWMTGVIIVEEIATTVLLLYHAYVVHKERRVVCKAEEDISV